MSMNFDEGVKYGYGGFIMKRFAWGLVLWNGYETKD
jgi:hypothetical protein